MNARHARLLKHSLEVVQGRYAHGPCGVLDLALELLVPWREHLITMAKRMPHICNHWVLSGAPLLHGYYCLHVARGPFDFVQLENLPGTTPLHSRQTLVDLQVVRPGGTEHDSVIADLPSVFRLERKRKHLPPSGSDVLEGMRESSWRGGLRIYTEDAHALVRSGVLLVRSLLAAGGLLNGNIGAAWYVIASEHLSSSAAQIAAYMGALTGPRLSDEWLSSLGLALPMAFRSLNVLLPQIELSDGVDEAGGGYQRRLRLRVSGGDAAQRQLFCCLASPGAQYDDHAGVLDLDLLDEGHVGLLCVGPLIASLSGQAHSAGLPTPNAGILRQLDPMRAFETAYQQPEMQQAQPDTYTEVSASLWPFIGQEIGG